MITAAELATRYGLVEAYNLADLVGAYAGNTLTNVNSATFAAGKIGNAVSLASASSQRLTLADTASFDVGLSDAWWSVWVNATSLAGSRSIVSKYTGSGNQRGYYLHYFGSTDRFRFNVSSDGIAVPVNLAANTFGAASTGTWIHVFAYHRGGVEVGIAINGGAFNTASFTGGIFPNTAKFNIGSRDDPTEFWSGLIDLVAYGKDPPGGFAATPPAEIRNILWNNGAGRDYPSLWALPAGGALAASTVTLGGVAAATTMAGGVSVQNRPVH